MPALRLATWNINSIRSRLDSLDRFVAAEQPDVICLQETRAQDSDFPLSHITDGLGYPHVALKGQKMHSGVAILSRLPLTRIDSRIWCGQDDCRHLSAVLAGDIEVHNFYVPAGGDVPDP
ncbi:MAG: endonuclease/exonuclease/phosphatase family protein, partial [Alphaproteobacteria bacterium]